MPGQHLLHADEVFAMNGGSGVWFGRGFPAVQLMAIGCLLLYWSALVVGVVAVLWHCFGDRPCRPVVVQSAFRFLDLHS